MTENLAERFERELTDTVHHRGRIVRSVVHLPVHDGARVTVRFDQVSTARPQGIKLAVDAGTVEVNDRTAPCVVLWSATSPAEVDLVVHGEAVTTLDVWNCWSLGGVDTSWIGNAGIVTRTLPRPGADACIRLLCSDGVGEVDFGDLEVELVVT